MVEFKHERSWTHPRTQRDSAGWEVDCVDLPGEQVGPRAQPPQWRDGVDQPDARRHDFGDERLEDEVVVAADKRHVDVVAPSEPALETHRRVHPGEATAED